ncbi:hypothetical protein FEM48_Zijuj05G0175300 [Ziziphus jujuba var. spinosa]|uniref:Uncharacterized protein n=1 Tax=Ziziphus jujuba var. spinosa TaxID=714518 RepID=A0A978VG64_ZIZJJ|nr:hypothetical protein FEM48_Zijuj05G0175300 [Ziziphus jujuba var. spinosa]
MLKLREQRTLYLNATSFKKLKSLWLLIFANVVFSTAIEYLPTELRLINLPAYQFPTLPFNAGPKQLVIVNMAHNHIHQLDKGFKNFERLKVLNFSRSKFLRKIPDLSTAPNLESLYVNHCASLVEIHESVGFLAKLVTLEAQHCKNLSTFPKEDILATLVGFPLLKSLDLSDNKFVSLPSLRKLSNLSALGLANCQLLGEIPELPERKMKIIASCCRSLVDTPSKIMAKLISNNAVNKIMIEGKPIKVPDSVSHIIDIDFDDFDGRGNQFGWSSRWKRRKHKLIEEVDKEIGHRESPEAGKWSRLWSADNVFHVFSANALDLSSCENLKLTPTCIYELYHLDQLDLGAAQYSEIPEFSEPEMNLNAIDCKSLVETPGRIMVKIIFHYNMGFLTDSEIEVILPGCNIPHWFSHNSVGESISFNVPSNKLKNMEAVIISAEFHQMELKHLTLQSELLQENNSPPGKEDAGEPKGLYLLVVQKVRRMLMVQNDFTFFQRAKRITLVSKRTSNEDNVDVQMVFNLFPAGKDDLEKEG